MAKYKSLIYSIFCVLFLQFCSEDDLIVQQPLNSSLESTVQIFFRTYQPSISLSKRVSSSLNLDTVVITFTHSSLQTIEHRFAYQEILTISGIPISQNWSISIQILNSNQMVLYTGIKTSVPVGEENNSFAIDCYPQFSKLDSRFVLDQSIVHGSMLLVHNQDSLFLNLSIEGVFGVFKADYLQIGNWNAQIFLYNEDSTFVLTGQNNFTTQIGESKEISIELTPQQSALESRIILKEKPVLNIRIQYIHSRSRSPLFKDLVISKFFPDPEKGEDFEWMEIINTSIDSLDISVCKILKTRSSIAASTSFSFTELLIWKPGQALIFGRDSVPFRDVSYSFRLTNTKQSILLLCGNILIDSLSYISQNSETDSIFVEDNFIASKDHFFYRQENLAEYWHTSEN